jgi:tetratricopeptide (TPR) repeat protein
MRVSGYRAMAAVGLCVLLTACKGTEQDAQKYLEEGKALLRKGKVEQARVQLQTALQIQPKLTEAYYNLALIDQKKQNGKAMFDNLQKTLGLDPNHVEAHLRLGKLYLDTRQFDKATEEASQVEQLQPDNIGLLVLRAGIAFFQGKNKEALELVGRALEKDPANLDATALAAFIYSATGDTSKAIASLNTSIERHPEDIELQLMKIRVESASKNFDAAIKDYKALINQYPDILVLNTGFVELLNTIGRSEEAEAVLRQMLNKDPTDVSFKLKLIDLLDRRDPVEAEKALKEFVGAQPRDIVFQSRLANLYVSQKRFTDAQGVLNRIIELDKTGREALSAKVRLAGIAIVQNDIKTAESLAAEVLKVDNSNADALILRAGILLSKNETDSAVSDLRIVLKSNPDSDKALVMLAQGYLQKGSPELADSNLRKALEINPGNLEAALPVAGKMIQAQELDRAEEVINKVLKTNPVNPNAMQVFVQIKVLKKDWVGAQAVVEELGKVPTESALSEFLSGVILANQGNLEGAAKRFQQALVLKPEYPEAIGGLAQVWNTKQSRKLLIKYLSEFTQKNPNVIEAQNTLGLTYAAEEQWRDSEKVLQQALSTDRKSENTYLALASIFAAQNKPSDVIATYRKGLVEFPDSTLLMLNLAQYYQNQKDIEPAIAVLTELLSKNPRVDFAANKLASLLTDYRTDKDSLKQASKLAERFSTSANPYFLDTYAWITLQSGNKDMALSALKKVVAAAPEMAIFHYHLGVAYLQKSEKGEAEKELKKALTFAEKQGKFTGIDHAKKLVEELSKSSAPTN